MGAVLDLALRSYLVIAKVQTQELTPVVRVLLFDHEVVALRTCVNRQQPFGREGSQAKIAETLGLESMMRQRGRPRKLLEK